MADPGGPGGPGPPLFSEQNEARRAEKILRPTPPYIRVWMTPPPPPASGSAPGIVNKADVMWNCLEFCCMLQKNMIS